MEDQRPALTRARKGQRPANGEALAGVIDRVDFGGIGKDVVLLVADERVRLPAFPKLDDDVEKFIAEHRKHAPARLALQRARVRLAPLNRDELHRVVDEWVEIAMALGEGELRVMDMLIQMQRAGAPA